MTMIYRQASWVRLEAEVEWCAAVIRQLRLFFAESEAVGADVHLHHDPIPDTLCSQAKTDDYCAATANVPLRHRNASFLGRCTVRDHQMPPLGNRGDRYVAHDYSSGANLKGWLLRSGRLCSLSALVL